MDNNNYNNSNEQQNDSVNTSSQSLNNRTLNEGSHYGEQLTGNERYGNRYQQNNAYQSSGNRYQQNTADYQPNGNRYQQNNAYQSNGNRYQQNNADYQSNGNRYQSNTSGYQSNGNQNYQEQVYQNTGYQNNVYQTANNQSKKKKEKKAGGFGTKLAKCAALALVFGLVSGTVMAGVNYAAGEALGVGTQNGNSAGSTSALTTSDNEAVKSTGTSTTYVAADISDIVDEVMPSIVAITNISETEYQSFWGGRPQTYESTSCGSGFIVSQDDNYLYIATNNHVVDGATTLTVTFADEATVSAEVKGTDPSMDLAVVKVALGSIEPATMENIKVATIGKSGNLRVGEACIAIGNALGYGQSVTTGVISALDREVTVADYESNTNYTADLIQTDAAINPGNSGGALLDASGAVIGINSVKYSDTGVEGIGYAIPMDTASPIINELITKEKVDKSDSAYLGIVGVDVTNDVAGTYNMPEGVYVAQVMEGSAAAQYGILQGDIVTAFDGKEIATMEALSTTLEYYAAGTTVDVTVQRANNGQYIEQTISVVLGKKN